MDRGNKLQGIIREDIVKEYRITAVLQYYKTLRYNSQEHVAHFFAKFAGKESHLKYKFLRGINASAID